MRKKDNEIIIIMTFISTLPVDEQKPDGVDMSALLVFVTTIEFLNFRLRGKKFIWR